LRIWLSLDGNHEPVIVPRSSGCWFKGARMARARSRARVG
jgi:hypothetical protein